MNGLICAPVPELHRPGPAEVSQRPHRDVNPLFVVSPADNHDAAAIPESGRRGRNLLEPLTPRVTKGSVNVRECVPVSRGVRVRGEDRQDSRGASPGRDERFCNVLVITFVDRIRFCNVLVITFIRRILRAFLALTQVRLRPVRRMRAAKDL